MKMLTQINIYGERFLDYLYWIVNFTSHNLSYNICVIYNILFLIYYKYILSIVTLLPMGENIFEGNAVFTV